VFGFNFTAVPACTIPVFHPDVGVWEVTHKASGKHIGYWGLDPYARAGKRSGAWASGYRSHATFDGPVTTLVSNNSNFVKPAPGEPPPISFDDATNAFFHEFGHALHGLSSSVEYPGLNGGVRDYTEFHSQLPEHWLLTDKVVATYFRHYKTGEPMPKALIDKIHKAATFNQGFETVEFLGSAIMDMRYHTVDPTHLDPRAFEKAELAKLGMPKEIPMRHRSDAVRAYLLERGTPPRATDGYSLGRRADVRCGGGVCGGAGRVLRQGAGGEDGREPVHGAQRGGSRREAYRAFRGARCDDGRVVAGDRGFPVPAPAAGQQFPAICGRSSACALASAEGRGTSR